MQKKRPTFPSNPLMASVLLFISAFGVGYAGGATNQESLYFVATGFLICGGITSLIFLVNLASYFGSKIANPSELQSGLTKLAAQTIETGKKATDAVTAARYRLGSNQARSQREIEAYAQVAREMEDGLVNQGLWTMAFSKSDGDEGKQRAAYIELRAAQILRSV